MFQPYQNLEKNTSPILRILMSTLTGQTHAQKRTVNIFFEFVSSGTSV